MPAPSEEHTVGDHSSELAYFSDQLNRSNDEFWSRFGRRPAVGGLDVLDLGCGHGALSVALAQEGARVCGVDLELRLIEFARRNVEERHPEVAGRIRFEPRAVTDLEPGERFDLVVSKDTFEHITDLPSVLDDVFRLLKPGGELWAGFSPLYFSPRGDHLRSGLGVPWAHAVLPKRVVLRAATRHNGRRVRTLADIGLNGLTPAGFRERFEASPFRVESLRYNGGDKARLRTLGVVRRFRPLERFATVSIYAVLVKPPV